MNKSKIKDGSWVSPGLMFPGTRAQIAAPRLQVSLAGTLLACLWIGGGRGQGEPRRNGNERASCHPIFGRDSVVRPDRQDNHLIAGLGDPAAL